MGINLRADQCPAVQVMTGALNPDSANPMTTMATVLVGTVVTDHRTRFAANATRIDKNARHGGAGICICSGMGISASGLVATLAPGEMKFDSVKDLLAPMVVTGGLADNLYNYLWWSVGGQFQKTTSSNPNAPAAPPAGGPWGFVGRIQAASGSPADTDTSGRLENRGGIVVRQTADVGPPLDTPPASTRFWALTRTGWYLWDGPAGAYVAVSTNRLPNVGSGALYLGGGEQRQFARKVSVRTGGVIRVNGAGSVLRVRG